MLSFTDEGWSDYISWDDEDRKTGKKIKKLIQSISRD